MKIKLYGKVLARSHHSSDRGESYSIVIEEPGIYPSQFQLTSRDASLFGQPDGPFGVGKMVVATAFANGREREVESKKKPGEKFKAYSVWFTLTKLEPAESPEAANTEDKVDESLPF